jgi:hypothetical protein
MSCAISSAMHRLALFPLKLKSLTTRAWYLQCEHRLARRAAASRALSILFSRRDPWEGPIRAGFRHLRHQLAFGDIQTADLERFDLIVPLSLGDARFMRGQSAHLRERMLPLPDEDCTALCHDKPRLNQRLIESGFGAHVPVMGDDLPPPYVCKPALGENSNDCTLVPDRATERRLGSALNRPGLFRQAAVPGHIEYATHFMMHDGMLLRELTVRYHHDAPMFIKGAPRARLQARTLGACPDLPTLRTMLACVGYAGLGCANYKMEGGVLRLLEINPRMGGSLSDYFFSFLRSMPSILRSSRHGCTNWTWLDSALERESVKLV